MLKYDVKFELAIMENDSFEGEFVGYVNKKYYHWGYCPHCDFETAKRIFELFKLSEDSRDYKTTWMYDKDEDCFIYEDLENGDGKEYFYGEDIETEDGIKHLYDVLELAWQIKGEE